jgi:hypothetical protein
VAPTTASTAPAAMTLGHQAVRRVRAIELPRVARAAGTAAPPDTAGSRRLCRMPMTSPLTSASTAPRRCPDHGNAVFTVRRERSTSAPSGPGTRFPQRGLPCCAQVRTGKHVGDRLRWPGWSARRGHERDADPPWIDPAERAMAGLPATRPRCRNRFVMAIP